MFEDLKKKKQRWYFKHRIISEKNGEICIRKFFGFVEIMVGGYYQSGPYIDRLFRKFLKVIPKKHPVKQVLLLGLGGGSAIRELKKRFPKAYVTAVEYDPIMVDLAKTLYLKPNDLASVEIILGNAKEVVRTIQKKFDLILSDLFIGMHVSQVTATHEFISLLSQRLEQDGYLGVNFFREKKTLGPIFDQHFSRWNDVTYAYNSMVMYRNFGQGNIGDPVPKEFSDRRQSRTYLEADTQGTDRKKIVGTCGCFGISSRYGRFVVEDYCSDQEPACDKGEKRTLINWQSYTKRDQSGWVINHLVGADFQRGFGIIDEQNLNSYWKSWSSHAKRHRTLWLRQDIYEMVRVDLDVFTVAYHASKKLDWLTRTGMVRVLAYHLNRHPSDVKCYVAREKSTQNIIAGLAVIDYSDIAQSCHTVSFFREDVRHTSVGVGLIDHWYACGIKEGIRFFNFGLVWKKGDPRAWKGYSQFKRQFDLYLLQYPKSFIKFLF